MTIDVAIRTARAGRADSVLRTAYIEAADCPIAWQMAVPIVVDDLLRALMARLTQPHLTSAQRRRTQDVLFDVVVPAETMSISTPLPHDARARTVAESVLRDPTDHRSLDQWGATVHVSGRTLARLFTAGTGTSFGQWRTSARMAAALEHLAAGQSVTRTGRLVGYDTTSAFVSAFARELGNTPGAYFAEEAAPTPFSTLQR